MADAFDISDAEMNTIDRYVLGALSPSEAARLEERASSKPDLAREIARQREMREVLLRAYPEPRAGLAEMQIARASTAPEIGTPQLMRRTWHGVPMAAAALLGLGITIGLVAAYRGRVFPFSHHAETQTPYAEVVADGFRPTFEQADPNLLEMIISEKLGASIALPRGSGIAYSGIRSNAGGSPLSVGIVMRIDDHRVLLVVDRTAPRSTDLTVKTTSCGGGIYRHDRTIGTISVAEWSDWEKPLVSGF